MEPAVLRFTFLLGMTFVTGCVLGYKANELRLIFMKARRDYLAAESAKAQKEREMTSVISLGSVGM